MATLTHLRASQRGTRPWRRTAGGALALAILVGAAAGLTGCAPPEGDPVQARDENFQKPAEPATHHPDGSAEDNLPYFAQTLEEFAAGDTPVEGAPIVDAVVAAGFDKAAMQVSFDRTQTGLVADSIYVSVRIGGDCLIGQVVTSDRSVTAVTEPAVGPAEDICLIGKTRPIDW